MARLLQDTRAWELLRGQCSDIGGRALQSRDACETCFDRCDSAARCRGFRYRFCLVMRLPHSSLRAGRLVADLDAQLSRRPSTELAAAPQDHICVSSGIPTCEGPQVGIPAGALCDRAVTCTQVEHGEPRYRVRSSVDGHERALLESQIKAREERPTKVEAPPARPARRRRVRVGSGANS